MRKRTTPAHAGQETAAQFAAMQTELHRLLAIKWWRWRRCYLEAKRLQMQARQDEG